MPDRDAERAFFRLAGFVYPYAAYRLCGCMQGHGRDQLQSLGWCQAVDAVNPGCLLPGVVLGHPAHRKAFCAPGRGEKLLESAGFLGLSTGRCWIDSSLELADAHLELAPGDGLPCRPMPWGMAHDVCTLLEDSSVDDHCSPVGVSLVLPWAFASGAIPAPTRVRVCVGLLTCVRAGGGFPSPCLACDAPVRVPLSAGCAVDGYGTYCDRAALATGLARRPWHRAHFWTQCSLRFTGAR
jgi:hypothetical protein